MQLFEAGILTKMTEEEYEKLGKKQRLESDQNSEIEQNEKVDSIEKANNNPSESTPSVGTAKTSVKQTAAVIEEERRSEPISLDMLQGAFYILIVGYIASGISLIFEYILHKRKKKQEVKKPKRQFRCLILLRKLLKQICTRYYKRLIKLVKLWGAEKLQEAIDEVALDSLEYLE